MYTPELVYRKQYLRHVQNVQNISICWRWQIPTKRNCPNSGKLVWSQHNIILYYLVTMLFSSPHGSTKPNKAGHEGWGRGRVSLCLTWSHLDSLGLTCTHLHSLALTWTHLISLGLMALTWCYLDSLGLTRSHLDSLELTWCPLDALGCAWSHWDSLDLTWTRVGSLVGLTWTYLKSLVLT